MWIPVRRAHSDKRRTSCDRGRLSGAWGDFTSEDHCCFLFVYQTQVANTISDRTVPITAPRAPASIASPTAANTTSITPPPPLHARSCKWHFGRAQNYTGSAFRLRLVAYQTGFPPRRLARRTGVPPPAPV